MIGFPTYERVVDARCFRCGGPLVDLGLSAYPPRHGQHVGRCRACNVATWFDVKETRHERREHHTGSTGGKWA